jgi:hypothetical protein
MESEGDLIMNNSTFSDFTVANDLDNLINYNIQNHNIKKDRHIKGIVGEVDGNTCDFYIYNSATPIPNVKVNSGLTVYEDEDVYALAINGSLSNLLIDSKVFNIDSLFGVVSANFKIVEGFQDYTE